MSCLIIHTFQTNMVNVLLTKYYVFFKQQVLHYWSDFWSKNASKIGCFVLKKSTGDKKVLSGTFSEIWHKKSNYTLKPVLIQNMVHFTWITNLGPLITFTGSTELKNSFPFKNPKIPKQNGPSSDAPKMGITTCKMKV